MSKRIKVKNILGIVIASIGIGLVLAILIPFWGFIIAGGVGLIYLGWCLIDNC